MVAKERLKSTVMLANDCDKLGGIDKVLSRYGGSAWMSEKYDGMRAMWNGRRLTSRYGKDIYAPRAWLEGIEEFRVSLGFGVLDGELWAGLGSMQEVMSVCRSHKYKEEAEEVAAEGIEKRALANRALANTLWSDIVYVIFDASDSQRGWLFTKEIVPRMTSWNGWTKNVLVAGQELVNSRREVEKRLDAVISSNGEGLMLRSPSLIWTPKRVLGLAKVKPEYDSEAIIVGYNPGAGKYEGLLGSLKVKDTGSLSGVEFDLSGMTDVEREQYREKFPIGSEVRYRYKGLTDSGVPRHGSLMR